MGAVLGHARVGTGGLDLPGQGSPLGCTRPGDALAAVRPDRLGRSLSGRLAVMADPKRRGVARLGLEGRRNTFSAARGPVFRVLGAIAHLERRLVAERTRDGVGASRAKGGHPGRRRVGRDKAAAAPKLVEAGPSPTQAAPGRAAVHRRTTPAGVRRRA